MFSQTPQYYIFHFLEAILNKLSMTEFNFSPKTGLSGLFFPPNICGEKVGF